MALLGHMREEGNSSPSAPMWSRSLGTRNLLLWGYSQGLEFSYRVSRLRYTLDSVTTICLLLGLLALE